MARMMRFLLYLIIFFAFFIYVTVISNVGVKGLVEDIQNIELLTESPIITVDKCEAGKYSGHIEGTIRNDTGKHIEKIYLQIDMYDNKQRYVGTKYEELKYFNVNEIVKFDTTFKAEDVKSLKLNVVYDEAQVKQVSEQNNDWSFGNTMTEENINLALPIVAGMMIFLIIP